MYPFALRTNKIILYGQLMAQHVLNNVSIIYTHFWVQHIVSCYLPDANSQCSIARECPNPHHHDVIHMPDNALVLPNIVQSYTALVSVVHHSKAGPHIKLYL